ncbi:MAG: pseudouridine-5'-phosphate glycosidase [Trueperaceae bacterium]|nr:pseudouridine-5'-phosphate glycosidase [Trueperaceae bacterium]
MRVAAPVRRALAAGLPVVALESTVLTHGLPRPENLELGRTLERIVREAGALPATVGVLAGTLVVGLDDAEMARLARGPASKASLWNLAGLAAQEADAGTTVATTLHAAGRCGIAVFATGGLGGVHDVPYDESADLAALARERVVTVCAGPKSMLDARATLERLETAGVAVVGWRSDHLAGFLTTSTDLPVPVRVEDVHDVARIVHAQRALGLPGAIVVSRGVDEGLDPAVLGGWLDEARRLAAEAGVRGRDVTPFLLDRLATISAGATVAVNLRVLAGNARLAAEIAVALAASPTDTRHESPDVHDAALSGSRGGQR